MEWSSFLPSPDVFGGFEVPLTPAYDPLMASPSELKNTGARLSRSVGYVLRTRTGISALLDERGCRRPKRGTNT